MGIPTEPIGSIPRPPALLAGIREFRAGRLSSEPLRRLYDEAIRDTIARFEATGSPVITDGEQSKPSFATYPIDGLDYLVPERVIPAYPRRPGRSPARVRSPPACTTGQFPILTGVRDFRDTAHVEKMSDAYWFWRLSEGVPQTPMSPMKDKLTEEERWQVIAYQHTFSHGRRAEEHAH